MMNFYSMDFTANTLITLVGYNFEIDAYGDYYYVDGFALDENESNRLIEWLTSETVHISEKYDADEWYTKDYKHIVIDWYGEDI